MRTVDEIREKMDEVMIEKEMEPISPLGLLHEEPFDKVMSDFKLTCHLVDKEGGEDEYLRNEFRENNERVKKAVDEYIENIASMERGIEHARRQKIFWEKETHKRDEELDKYKSEIAGTLTYGSRYLGRNGSIRLVKSSPALFIISEKAIPPEFKKTETKYVVDKIALKEYLLNGNKAEGATIRRNEHITILKS